MKGKRRQIKAISLTCETQRTGAVVMVTEVSTGTAIAAWGTMTQTDCCAVGSSAYKKGSHYIQCNNFV